MGWAKGLSLVDVGVDFGVELVEAFQLLRLVQSSGGHGLCSRFLVSSLHLAAVEYQKYSPSAAKVVSSRNC